MNVKPPEDRLEGLRIFIVEDEAVIAMALEDMLADLGCTVVDVAGTLTQAMGRVEAMASEADGAILDVNLGGEKSYPVADALHRLAMPFFFTTGYDPSSLDERYREMPILGKPVHPAALAGALNGLRERRGA